ncbi:Aldolase-type TIM barrel [Penicillium argentinense]|uniref:deoxyribose-phosphate aldolase n=1 Tax=Penicillium argentinense TaxID=1131581 RepID=A0A9W9ENK4_9EURO|nr:Aldolase-type TIM barrel [Penicillium argentinense]KAJ5085009.1 Aldolase-type TIM barrel [Penicillium argentinense]
MSSIPSTDAEWETLISRVRDRVPNRCLSQPTIPLQVPRMIDHTLLKRPIEPEQIDVLCQEARDQEFASVCVWLDYVSQAAANLRDAPRTVVACVVGFPEGTHDTADKVHEAKEAISQGASELDMVINWPKLKNGGYTSVFEDIMAVRKAAPSPTIIKAILEANQLDRDELIAATTICCLAGVDYVKTSTGFNGPGANVNQVTIMRLTAKACDNHDISVKASGGIRTAVDCLRMIKAGATRIGTSAGVQIMKDLDEGELLEQGASHAVS